MYEVRVWRINSVFNYFSTSLITPNKVLSILRDSFTNNDEETVVQFV